MATTDKHPPLDPNRHSTNKRVPAKIDPYFGTRFTTAEGSKRVKPGDKASTSAKTVDLTGTRIQDERDAQAARDAKMWGQESKKTIARDGLIKRGWMTQNEVLTLQRSYRKNMT